MDHVSAADQSNLNAIGLKTGPQAFTRDLQTENNIRHPNVNLEIENNDVLKANSLSIKFIGLNTPSSLPPNMEAIPKSLFFTFKFYTFQAIQTEKANLTTTKSIEEGKFDAGALALAKQYYLVQEDQIRLF